MERGGAVRGRGRVPALGGQPQAHLDQGPADPGAQAGAGEADGPCSGVEFGCLDRVQEVVDVGMHNGIPFQA
ncbi:hypothetical protein GCM10027028_33720 [Streptomyces sundarbansensis]